jgi:rubrerythrin
LSRGRKGLLVRWLERTMVETKYNAFEILQIAEKIECNGAEFYRRCVKLVESDRLRGMFNKLAEWEERHEKLFRQMRNEFGKQMSELEDLEPAIYVRCDPRMIEGLAMSVIRPESAHALTGGESVRGIIGRALELEKGTLVFYEELKEKAQDLSGLYKIGDIIKEEKRHIMVLRRLLEELV